MVRKALLLCGVAASLVYIVRDLGALLNYPGYDFANQVISELSAIDVPSRRVDLAFGWTYGVLTILFGLGIWLSAKNKPALNVTSALVIAASVFGAFWPPMHTRGQPATLTDTLHIVWTAGWFTLTICAMGFACAALGRRFTYYTIATVVSMLLFGSLTGWQGVHLAANQPTPGIGIYERINIGAFLLWQVVLAAQLWPKAHPMPATRLPAT
jgi:hypothetical membrane protein